MISCKPTSCWFIVSECFQHLLKESTDQGLSVCLPRKMSPTACHLLYCTASGDQRLPDKTNRDIKEIAIDAVAPCLVSMRHTAEWRRIKVVTALISSCLRCATGQRRVSLDVLAARAS